MAIQEVQSISSLISGYLEQIENAKYGQRVRETIVAALEEIAKDVDDALRTTNDNVASAINAISGDNASNYSDILSQAQSASASIQELQGIADSIRAALSTVKNVTTVEIPYVKREVNGQEVWEGNGGSYPKIVSSGSGNNVSWEYQTLKVPSFKNVVIDRLDYNKLGSTEKEKFVDSVEYNPNEGRLHVTVADPLSRLQVHVVNTVEYDASLLNNGALPVRFEYDANNVPHLYLTLMRGPTGHFGGSVNYRPFIRRIKLVGEDLNNQQLSYSSENTEKAQILFKGLQNHDFDNITQTYREYSVYKDASPAFDALIIVFKKSPRFTEFNNFSSGVNIKDNDDYESGTTVFIPRGGHATATMVDRKNRMFVRDIYWLDGTYSLKRFCWNTKTKDADKKNEWPKTVLIKSTETAPSGASLVTEYTGPGIFFSHVRMNDMNNKSQGQQGDLVEWTWQSNGVYAQQQLTGSNKNPSTNMNINKSYDQFLIPVEVYGVFYQLWDERVQNLVNTVV